MMVRLPEETYGLLKNRAEALGIPPAVLVRAYVKEALEDRDDFSVLTRSVVNGSEDLEPAVVGAPSSGRRSPNAKRKKKKNR
jgi:predicted DNA-binding protein